MTIEEQKQKQSHNHQIELHRWARGEKNRAGDPIYSPLSPPLFHGGGFTVVSQPETMTVTLPCRSLTASESRWQLSQKTNKRIQEGSQRGRRLLRNRRLTCEHSPGKDCHLEPASHRQLCSNAQLIARAERKRPDIKLASVNDLPPSQVRPQSVQVRPSERRVVLPQWLTVH